MYKILRLVWCLKHDAVTISLQWYAASTGFRCGGGSFPRPWSLCPWRCTCLSTGTMHTSRPTVSVRRRPWLRSASTGCVELNDFLHPLGGVYTPHVDGHPQTQTPLWGCPRGCCTPYIYNEQLLSVTVERRPNPTIVILRLAQAAKTFIVCNSFADNFSFDGLWFVISTQTNILIDYWVYVV